MKSQFLCQSCLPPLETIDFQHQIRCPFKSCIRSGIHSPSQLSIDVTLQNLTTSLRTASQQSKSLVNILGEDSESDKVHRQPDTLYYGDITLDPSWNATLDGLYDPYEPASTSSAQISTPPSVFYRNIPIIIDTIRSKIQQDIECQVCFLVFDQPITTYCGHTFCKSCLITSLDYKPNCPLCRHELPLYMHYHNQPPNKALIRFIQYLNNRPNAEQSEDASLEGREIEPTLSMTPLFVSSLIFPRMPCYLLVFEPRYRKLLRNVLKTESKLFGMVLPPRPRKHRDQERSSWEPSMEYGTLLKVHSCELLPDGRALVETIGVSRFQILTFSMMDGYFAATAIELVHDISTEHELGLEMAAIEAGSTQKSASRSGTDTLLSTIGIEDELSSNGHLLGRQNRQIQSSEGSRSTQVLNSTSSPRLLSSSSSSTPLIAPLDNGDSPPATANEASMSQPQLNLAGELDLKDLHTLELETLSQKQLMEILSAFVSQMQDRLGPMATRRLQREYGNMIEDDGRAFSFWVASILPMHEHQKYELLKVISVRERLLAVLNWIKMIENRRSTATSFQELWEKYGHELIYMSIIIFILVTYWVGKKHNEVLAKTTMAVMLPLFRANFARVGDNGAELAIDAPHEYIIYLTGRRHVATVHGLIKMRPRQDLIRTIFTLFSTPTQDTCTLNVTMNPNEYSDGVFAIVPKSTGTTIRNKHYDLATFTKASNQKALDSSLITLTESNELTDAILPLVSEHLNEAAQWLDYFIVTDQPTHKPATLPTKPHAKRISLSFRLPNAKNAREILPLVEALVACLDGLPRGCHTTAATKARISKAREEALKEVGKKAQAEKARELEEKRLKEKREQEKNLSPEAQRKLAAKEEKKAIKKRQKMNTKKV
ncbi:hypothetical protein BGX27_005503 [Mortierella sp. AM989]|nr:hypothetical protein BGX27_005503 [Mortierella sp. AM989]